MATIDTSGKPAYMYDADTSTWYAISGRVPTGANYIWSGTHQFDNNSFFNGAITATLKFNSFLNPAARASAITAPSTGLITFIQQDAIGNTINRFEYWDGSAWIAYADPATTVTLTGTQTLTNKTLTSASVNTAVISSPTITGSASVTGAINITGQLDVAEIREDVTDLAVSASVVTMNFTQTNIGYVSASASSNFTLNATNVPTDNGKTITLSLFLTQGATGYIPSVFQVDGVGQTIKWAGGVAPTPTSSAGKIDIFNFTLVRRSNSWTVFGNMNANF